MILVFGGAFQGKSEYALTALGASPEDFEDCSAGAGALEGKVLDNFNTLILGMLESDPGPVEWVSSNLDRLRDKTIIIEDVSCGLVPMGSEWRLYRDAVGKITQLLARNSTEVHRVFAGIGQRIK